MVKWAYLRPTRRTIPEKTHLWLHAAVALGLWGECCIAYVAINMQLLILTSPESSRKGNICKRGAGTKLVAKKMTPFMEKESLVQTTTEFSAVCWGTTKALKCRPGGGVQMNGRWTSDGSSVLICFVLIPDLQFQDFAIFCVHDRRKILNSYWFYNVLEPRTPLFFLFLLIHFLSWAIVRT